MLEITDLNANYSGIQALRGVACRCNQGEMVALIGPNGAGKSTLLNCVSGQIQPAGGSIQLEGAR
jgi:branched-chain amino acid transport system ATP-binding protein